MGQYITELSKYFIALFIALYTYECFAVFRYESEEERRGIYIRQNILMVITHLTSYISIIIIGGKIEYIFFFIFQQIALFTVIVLFQMIYPKSNRLIVNNMCMLLSIGFVMLTRISYDKAVKQFMIVIVSLVIALIVPYLVKKIKYANYMPWLFAVVGILVLGVVLMLGAVTNGSKISFSIARITFQPSEFIKILFIFCIAAFLRESESLIQIFLSSLAAGMHILILVLSKDLGSALIFFIAYVIMVYCATKNPVFLGIGAVSGTIAAMIAYHIFTHVQVRVQAWRDPFSTIDGNGFQIGQSLFAISGGSWFGMGIGQGTPHSIPHVETDFIFAAIAEELGVIYGVCLILICISCFIMFMNIAMQLKEQFYRLIVIGCGTTYIFQLFLTIGGGIKFIPLTGVTLPLISYGGSSVLTTLIMFSVVQGLYLIKQEEKGKRKINGEKAKAKK